MSQAPEIRSHSCGLQHLQGPAGSWTCAFFMAVGKWSRITEIVRMAYHVIYWYSYIFSKRTNLLVGWMNELTSNNCYLFDVSATAHNPWSGRVLPPFFHLMMYTEEIIRKWLLSPEIYVFGCRSKIENELLTKKRGKFLYCSSLRDREDKKRRYWSQITSIGSMRRMWHSSGNLTGSLHTWKGEQKG